MSNHDFGTAGDTNYRQTINDISYRWKLMSNNPINYSTHRRVDTTEYVKIQKSIEYYERLVSKYYDKLTKESRDFVENMIIQKSLLMELNGTEGLISDIDKALDKLFDGFKDVEEETRKKERVGEIREMLKRVGNEGRKV